MRARRAVIEAAARRAGWTDWKPASGRGHGIGFAKYKNLGAYCAVVAEVEVERAVRVRRLVVAVDVGLAINPDGIANQLEGGAVQATSWTLKEAVAFDARGITSLGWEDYPILRFSEVPAVEVELIDRPELPSVGAGEAAQGPTAAAIANAVGQCARRARAHPAAHRRRDPRRDRSELRSASILRLAAGARGGAAHLRRRHLGEHGCHRRMTADRAPNRRRAALPNNGASGARGAQRSAKNSRGASAQSADVRGVTDGKGVAIEQAPRSPRDADARHQ